MILKEIPPNKSNQNHGYLFQRVFYVIVVLIFIGLSLQQTATGTELTDQSGKIIRFNHPFVRIISLYGAHTENLAYLGLENEIIGRTSEDDYPSSITIKPEFSDRDDPEKFIAAHPDLVLIRPMIESSHTELFTKLEQAGITVVSLQPTTVDQMFAYWRDLGMLTGKKELAETMITEFRAGLTRIEKTFADIPDKKRPRVYFESIHSKMRTFSPDSITIFSLKSAGGINIATDAIPRHATNIAEYGKERLLSHADEIDVFFAQTGRMNRIEKRTIMEETGFQVIKAIRDDLVYLIDEKLISRPTMRLLLGIEHLNSILYPFNGRIGNN
jgi:iron complex transport system substrate-binding protein